LIIKEEILGNYAAVGKDFDKNHKVVSTIVTEFDTIDKCQEWCDKANRNGRGAFNYKPYSTKEIKEHFPEFKGKL
jgi:hypothetical protein